MTEVSGNIQLPSLEEDDEGTLDEPVLTTLVGAKDWQQVFSKLFRPPRNETGRLSLRSASMYLYRIGQTSPFCTIVSE